MEIVFWCDIIYEYVCGCVFEFIVVEICLFVERVYWEVGNVGIVDDFEVI